MSDLTEFLLTRIAEDEAVARALSSQEDYMLSQSFYGHSSVDAPVTAFMERFGIARVLAECESKRRIMEECADLASSEDVYTHADLILHALALPYADRPEYREAWRP